MAAKQRVDISQLSKARTVERRSKFNGTKQLARPASAGQGQKISCAERRWSPPGGRLARRPAIACVAWAPLSAIVVSRHTFLDRAVGRSASLTKAPVGARRADCGAQEAEPRKIVAVCWPRRRAPSLHRDKRNGHPRGVGGLPNLPIRCAQIFRQTTISLMDFCLVPLSGFVPPVTRACRRSRRSSAQG